MSNHAQSFDPARRDFSPYGLSCGYWQASLMARPDYHNEVELNFLAEGSVTYLIGGRKVTVSAGTLCLFWAAIPHQIIHFTGDAPYFVATVPLHAFLQWQLPENFVQALLQGRVLMSDASAGTAADLARFNQWAQDLQADNPAFSRAVALEMQARVLRMALSEVEPSDPARWRNHLAGLPETGLSKVEQMACYIAQHYVNKISVAEVAQAVNLHPSYAMSLFQKTFGTTLVNVLTQHRVAHAQRLLIATDKPITEISLESGFNSLSRFNEAFMQHCACSPRTYRKQEKANHRA